MKSVTLIVALVLLICSAYSLKLNPLLARVNKKHLPLLLDYCMRDPATNLCWAEMGDESLPKNIGIYKVCFLRKTGNEFCTKAKLDFGQKIRKIFKQVKHFLKSILPGEQIDVKNICIKDPVTNMCEGANNDKPTSDFTFGFALRAFVKNHLQKRGIDRVCYHDASTKSCIEVDGIQIY